LLTIRGAVRREPAPLHMAHELRLRSRESSSRVHRVIVD
jgi:hypothetical protein